MADNGYVSRSNSTPMFSRTWQKLASLPLFMGLGSGDMESILGKVRFYFQQATAGKVLFTEGMANSQLFFLLEGSIVLSHRSNSSRITFLETATAPTMLGADILFGLSHHFTYTVTSASPIQYLTLSKSEITTHLLHYEVFRLNFLNHLSRQNQLRQRLLNETWPKDIRERLLLYLRQNIALPHGPKTIQGRQEDLAQEIATSEKRLHKVLAAYQQVGLMGIGRSHIDIPSMQHLLQP